MGIGYSYTHSKIDGNGHEYISFMTQPEALDECGMRCGKAVHIDIDHRRQKTTIFSYTWLHGAPRAWKTIATLNDETICEAEVPALMERLGIVFAEKEEA